MLHFKPNAQERATFFKTGSVWGFVFGPLYYIYLKMYHKAALLFVAILIWSGLVQLAEATTGYTIPNVVNWLPNLLLSLFCSQQVAFDYFNFVRFGDKHWGGPAWLQTTRGVAAVTTIAVLFSLAAFIGVDAPEDVLAKLDGVWQTDDNITVKVNLGGTRKTLMWGQTSLSCKLKNADTSSYMVVLNCTNPQSTFYLVTLRQAYDGAGKTFRLGLRFGDGDEKVLGYLRPL